MDVAAEHGLYKGFFTHVANGSKAVSSILAAPLPANFVSRDGSSLAPAACFTSRQQQKFNPLLH